MQVDTGHQGKDNGSIMKINQREEGNVVVLDMDGDIDIFSAYELRDLVHDIVDRGKTNILLNLEKTFYIDSTGVGVIASTFKLVKRQGGQFKLEKLSAQIKSLIAIAGLLKIIEMYDSEAEALKSFQAV